MVGSLLQILWFSSIGAQIYLFAARECDLKEVLSISLSLGSLSTCLNHYFSSSVNWSRGSFLGI
ncbi:hypothetical protein I3760_15G066900 [Carya illinoinensis]|nr:hypothetical protein I3760_15G066900 [Carya illinoinensis]